ncbi:MAG: ABC-F family ATP-binding cassette domain-containing protein [Oscillospiraceae bacterium]|nr:ABC-F family ATP-binding cassette domain-containing protein [Oscillospiraceae bacterium]
MIKVEKLTFGFNSTPLFQNITFTLEENCHCAMIGSNGTGKTTLMNLIREPDKFLFDGKLKLDGAGRIGYVSQFAIREGDQSITVYDYLCQDFLELEQAIGDVCMQMETAEDMDAVMDRYQQLLDESDSVDADNYEVNIRRQLKLAELENKETLELEKLSGGELKLVQVIRQMLRRPGLLIMDEPDVFLDFENLNGLRDLINAYQGTLLVVTHSRYLLVHCFDRIWHLENGDLQEFEGSFTEYSYSRLQKKIDLQIAAIADEEEIQRLNELVERLRDNAEEKIDPARGRTLRSKVSYLNRLLSRQIKAPFVEIRQPDIRLPEVEPAEEPTELLRLEDYSLSFEETLLKDVSFAVHSGEKVALVGANGTGKTSMLREIWKNEHPAIRFTENAVPAFFSQLHAEILNEQNTIYEEFFDIGFETHAQVEEYLSKYCFDPDSLGRKVGHLSGGEKNLLQLAKLASGNANILLLDEPSSHLDTFAQIGLENAIAAYPGAVLMVSHDFYTIVNCADTILFVEDGGIRPMSARAFRKMIYKKHFSKDYLELELQKKDYETRIERYLEAGDCVEAQRLCDKLADVVEQMKRA